MGDIHTAARCQVASLLQSSTTSTKTESISSKKITTTASTAKEKRSTARDGVKGSLIMEDIATKEAFVTLATDGRTGATEAVMTSRQCLQMMVEGVLIDPDDNSSMDDDNEKERDDKYVDNNDHSIRTSVPVVVDGIETQSLDGLLLLSNVALLQSNGLYGGGCGDINIGNNVKAGKDVKKSPMRSGGTTGTLSSAFRRKIRNLLLQSDKSAQQNKGAMNNDDDDNVVGNKLMDELCDFGVLCAFDCALGGGGVKGEELCRVVSRYVAANGRKGRKSKIRDGNSSIFISNDLRKALLDALESGRC